jgi:hypothetical protein
MVAQAAWSLKKGVTVRFQRDVQVVELRKVPQAQRMLAQSCTAARKPAGL